MQPKTGSRNYAKRLWKELALPYCNEQVRDTNFQCTQNNLAKVKITEIIPFNEKTNVKKRTFLVPMDVMSLDTNIQQNEVILKLSVTKHMKISTKTAHSYTLLARNAYSPAIWCKKIAELCTL